MSSKSTIILTKDNEHWYEDCSVPLTEFGESPVKDEITLEFDKKNIRIDCNDENDLVISIINPHCDIYDAITSLKGFLDKKK